MAKNLTDIRSMARNHTAKALSTLASIMNEKKANPAARVAAAQALLDRGWGKATQTIEATINNADASRVSDLELATIIAADRGEGVAETEIDPSQLN
jgi:isocitrate dehydrogenase